MKKLLITVILCMVAAVYALSQNMTTNAAVNMRFNPNTSSNVIEVIPCGMQVYVVNIYFSGWAQIIYNKQLGYVFSPYLYYNDDSSTQSKEYVRCYTNSYGQRIQSPTFSPSAPQGATARCVDGTYSYSQSRRGTCSHHGGVAEWL